MLFASPWQNSGRSPRSIPALSAHSCGCTPWCSSSSTARDRGGAAPDGSRPDPRPLLATSPVSHGGLRRMVGYVLLENRCREQPPGGSTASSPRRHGAKRCGLAPPRQSIWRSFILRGRLVASKRVMLAVVLVLGLATALSVCVVLLQRERSRTATSELFRNRLCSTRLWRLQRLAQPQDPRDRTDRHDDMHELTDQQISSMCVGTSPPVSASDAEFCWIISSR